MVNQGFLNRDIGTKLVAVGCVLGMLSLVLPYANYTDTLTLNPLAASSLTGITWQGGQFFLFLFGMLLLLTYLVNQPRIRAVSAAIVGGIALLLPILIFQLEIPTPQPETTYTSGLGVLIASFAGVLILLGSVYWWVRPDHSYPQTGVPASELNSE